MSTYGFTIQTQDNRDPIVLDGPKTYKPVTIAAGENTVAQGQLLARDITADTYKKLGALASYSEAVSMGQNDSRVNLSGSLSRIPVLPGSVEVELGSLDFADAGNRKGMLTGDDGFGTVNYANGNIALALKTAALSTSLCTVSYSHFGNTGSLDIGDIVVNTVKAENATAATKITALTEGFVNPLRFTPTVDRTDPKTYLCFKDSGLRLK